LTTIFPDQTAYRDTLECILASPKDIGWEKDRNGFRKSFSYQAQCTFPRSGRYVFKIAHAMREAEINGITEVGLNCKASKQINKS
jgi:gliding motility-associated lipoprotein GldH